MTVSPNQFAQSAVKGQPDLYFQPNTIPCRVYSELVTPLVPGQAVKLVDVIGGAPVVTAVAADTDDIFGIVGYNIKNAEFEAGAPVEIYAQGDVVYLESDAAIARGAKVMYVVTDEQIATATAGKSIVGISLDKATAADQLIRVYLLTFSGASDVSFTPAANVAALAGTLTGSVTGTMADVPAATAAVTDTTAASLTSTNTAITALNLQLKELQTKVNAEILALKNAGLQLTA